MSKLVRDYIPHVIHQHGKKAVYHREMGKLFSNLIEKLKEETEEVCNAEDVYEFVQELADVYEVISCLANSVGLDIEDVTDVARVKRKTKGSFTQGIVLDEVK